MLPLRDLPEGDIRPGSSPPPDQYSLEPGYRLELVADHLTYPTCVTFSPRCIPLPMDTRWSG